MYLWWKTHRWTLPRQPIVTGTSVLALKYKDGIMMAADTLGNLSSCLVLIMCLKELASVIWLPCSFQGYPAIASRWQIYRHRRWWRYV